ncbi:MAG: hypothetical protein FJ146_19450 [Deltaproteobacteria bacterium]|nr:hypothetical protein [Deltaproteobacteria bacterium]
MGARARVDKIELYVSYSDFNRRIGLINNYYDLVSLGLEGHDFSGCFMCDDLSQLIDFCREHRQYHIVTCDGPGRRVNRLIQGKDYYMLANGDRDPALVLNYLLDPDWPLSYEDGVSSALAELDNIKNGRKS